MLTLRAELHGAMLVIQSHTTCFRLLCKRIHTLHVSLQQVVLVFDPIFNKVLEFFHLNLDDDIVDLRIITVTLLGLQVTSVS